jgi:hypothetical protein
MISLEKGNEYLCFTTMRVARDWSYLFIVAFVALAATAGMSQAASYINSSFLRLGQKLGSYFS